MLVSRSNKMVSFGKRSRNWLIWSYQCFRSRKSL